MSRPNFFNEKFVLRYEDFQTDRSQVDGSLYREKKKALFQLLFFLSNSF